ncbi:MAG: hypothetical protein GX440_11815 [Propionibacterium sp.]|nr:hypothetical protein [Propionibacterium sp.]
MSGSRSGRRSSRRKLNRKSVLGALLGLTLTLGMFPSSMAAADTPDPSDTASAAESSVSSGATSPTPSGERSQGAEETASQESKADELESAESTSQAPSSTDSEVNETSAGALAPLIAGVPDGGNAPYVYWDVKDDEGNLVPGATFKFEYWSSGSWSGSWTSGTNAAAIADCSGTCTIDTNGNSLDRDADGGEFLLEHRATNRDGSNRLVAGTNYRVSQVSPPAGYQWVVSGSNTKTIGATWNGTSTHNFGTFVVKRIETAPKCEAGYVYGIQDSGQIRQVASDGTVTNLGSPSGTGGTFNGLGIGSGGSPVFAYARSGQGNSDSNVSIYRYDTVTGTWTDTGHNVDSTQGSNRNVTFVAGAVNLDTGKYFLGGYRTSSNARTFNIWEYDPATNTSTYKGYINAGDSSGSANGDMAFDADGNLFIVRGSASTTTIYSVTSANLTAANGGLIASSGASSVNNTTSNVNGVAFDADGHGFLSSSGEVQKYNMPGWTDRAPVTSSLGGSNDLSSCGSPPTITIEKEVQGGRVNTTDQFTLSLKQGDTTISEATTEGSATGVQDQRIGPIPTVRNVSLTFSEGAAGTTNLSQYASAYQCTVTYRDGTVQNLEQVNGTSGSITIPSTGDAVRCVFRNSPLVANVSVQKQVTDTSGENPTARSGWMVGAASTATVGSVTQAPSATTGTTDASGTASWALNFGTNASTATVAVHEEMQDDYVFSRGQCTVTSLSGDSVSTPLITPEVTVLSGVKPGDNVVCTYVNQPAPQSTLTLVKSVENNHGGSAQVSDFSLTATPDDGSALSFTSGETQEIEPGRYLIGETLRPGYEQVSLACAAGDEDLAVTDSAVEIGTGQDVTCTLTNQDKPGSVTWSKVDDEGGLLAGAVWTLTGPDQGTEVDIEDCVATSAASCTGLDKDPAGGQFKAEDLAWGDYILAEKTAPPGYQRTGENLEFAIAGDALEISLDEIANEQQPGAVLPLTGGLGRDAFLLGGTTLLLLAAGALVVRQRRARRVQQG